MAGVFWRARPTRARCLPPFSWTLPTCRRQACTCAASGQPVRRAAGCARALRRGGAVVYVNLPSNGRCWSPAAACSAAGSARSRCCPYAALWEQQVQELLLTKRSAGSSSLRPPARPPPLRTSPAARARRAGAARHRRCCATSPTRAASCAPRARRCAGRGDARRRQRRHRDCSTRELRLKHCNGGLRGADRRRCRACARHRLDELFDLGGAAGDDGFARSACAAAPARHESSTSSAARRRAAVGSASNARRSSMRAARSTAVLSARRLDPMRERDVAVGAARRLWSSRRAGPRGRHRRTLLDATRRRCRRWGSAARTSARRRWRRSTAELADGTGADGRAAARQRAERRETSYASRRRPGTRCCRWKVDRATRRPGPRESILLLARDIGERKRAELALLESAERFRSLFDREPGGPAAARREPARAAVQPRGEPPARPGADRPGRRRVAALLHAADAAAAARLRRDLQASACARTMPTCAWCRRTPRRLDAAGRSRLAGRAKPRFCWCWKTTSISCTRLLNCARYASSLQLVGWPACEGSFPHLIRFRLHPPKSR